MARLLRKAIAVLAAYAIVIQALLTGVAVAAHVAPDSFSVICSSQGSVDHPGVPAHHDADCGLCTLSCENASALPAIFKSVITLKRIIVFGHAIAWFSAPPSSARYEPHASRAPPILT